MIVLPCHQESAFGLNENMSLSLVNCVDDIEDIRNRQLEASTI